MFYDIAYGRRQRGGLKISTPKGENQRAKLRDSIGSLMLELWEETSVLTWTFLGRRRSELAMAVKSASFEGMANNHYHEHNGVLTERAFFRWFTHPSCTWASVEFYFSTCFTIIRLTSTSRARPWLFPVR